MLLTDTAPPGILDDPGVEFVFPEYRNSLTLRIVVDAGGVDQSRLSRSRRLLDRFDKPSTLPQMNKLAGFG